MTEGNYIYVSLGTRGVMPSGYSNFTSVENIYKDFLAAITLAIVSR